MIDLGLFEIGTDVFLMIMACAFFALQMFLCIRIQKRWLRLLPAVALLVAITILVFLVFLTDGWNSIGFLLIALWTLLLLVACGAAWLIWFLICKKRKSK